MGPSVADSCFEADSHTMGRSCQWAFVRLLAVRRAQTRVPPWPAHATAQPRHPAASCDTARGPRCRRGLRRIRPSRNGAGRVHLTVRDVGLWAHRGMALSRWPCLSGTRAKASWSSAPRPDCVGRWPHGPGCGILTSVRSVDRPRGKPEGGQGRYGGGGQRPNRAGGRTGGRPRAGGLGSMRRAVSRQGTVPRLLSARERQG